MAIDPTLSHSDPLSAYRPSSNPLLEPSGLFEDALDFSKIQTEHFIPALKEAILRSKQRISEIKSKPPSFANTIEGLEFSADELTRVKHTHGNYESALNSPRLMEISKDFYSLASSFKSDLSLDKDLFTLVKTVYEKDKNSPSLSTEQKTLLENTYKFFVRNGALLDEKGKEEIRQIDQKLSQLKPRFAENVLKCTNRFTLWIEKESDLEGLPKTITEAARNDARAWEDLHKKPAEGTWLFTLQAPSLIPFLTYAKNRDLREKMWMAFNQRAYLPGENSNQEVVLETVKLRHQRALILGFKNHASYVLSERMAESPEKVFEFLNKILERVKPAAEKDMVELKNFALESESLADLKPWDVAYFSEKLKEKKFAFNNEDLRPYFSLAKVIDGTFKHAEKLFSVKFLERSDLPVYHPDVQAFEVQDAKTGKTLGLFYADFFPRESKRAGAWMTLFRDQGLSRGELKNPQVSIVCNFTRPTHGTPALLNLQEVLTLFHEFGHALHGLLSQCRYKSLSGPQVFWDFVELPSQIMENWAYEKECLDLFAFHHQTGEPIPQDLLDKLERSLNFQNGLSGLRQIQFSLLDMKWHTIDPKMISDVTSFEDQAIANLRSLPKIDSTNSSCAFSHIFAGGYSAGYYSYKWAEVLDADAFELFKQKGIYNEEVAQSFKQNILSLGGSDHPMTLYKKFRGREPDPEALFRRDGLIP